MTPAEIAALLALPESARAKLANIAGPGWFVSARTDGTESLATASPGVDFNNPSEREYCASIVMNGRVWAWCPADTFAIVQACGRINVLETCVEGDFTAACWHGNGTGISERNATPRLAALRLLAAVTT